MSPQIPMHASLLLPHHEVAAAVASLGEAWLALRHERVLLTGGSGFLGRWLMETYLYAWEQWDLRGGLWVTTRDQDAFRARFPGLAEHPALHLVQSGLQDLNPVSLGHFPWILHLAVQYAPSSRLLQANLEAFLRLMELAQTGGTRRFLFASSGAVYGPQPGSLAAIPEDWPVAPLPTDPAEAYGSMKRACEALGTQWAHQTGGDFLVARGFAFSGAGVPHHSTGAFAQFVDHAIQGRPIRFTTAGEVLRSYLDAGDMAHWFWQILFKGRSCHPYNVGGADPISLLTLAERIRDLLQPDLAILPAPVDAPSAPRLRYLPDLTRASSELGLAARVPLKASILHTAAWLKGLRP